MADNADAVWDNLIVWLEAFDPNIRRTLPVYSKSIPGKSTSYSYQNISQESLISGANRGLFVAKGVSVSKIVAQLEGVTCSMVRW